MKFDKLKKVQEDIKSSSAELYGNKRIIITDCKSIIDYSKESIAIDLGELKMKISGKNLVADSFVFDQTDICGVIEKIEFF